MYNKQDPGPRPYGPDYENEQPGPILSSWGPKIAFFPGAGAGPRRAPAYFKPCIYIVCCWLRLNELNGTFGVCAAAIWFCLMIATHLSVYSLCFFVHIFFRFVEYRIFVASALMYCPCALVAYNALVAFCLRKSCYM
jgi:hypothetical protein